SLYEERARETGGKIDILFVTAEGRPLTQNAYERLWELLRERAGLYQPTEIGARQRIHPHGMRHFLRTQAKLHSVDSGAAKFALGHKPKGEYRYDKSHLEPKWCEIVEKELGKMTEVLNLRTGLAQEYYASKEEELRMKAASDTYKALFDSGLLKPEALTEPVQRRILEKLGINPTIQVRLMAEDENLPPEVRTRVALFGAIAQKIGLDTEVYHRYTEALEVLRENSAQSSWENHTDYYLRVEVGSDNYMKALADGFKTRDQDGTTRIMLKPKR